MLKTTIVCFILWNYQVVALFEQLPDDSIE